MRFTIFLCLLFLSLRSFTQDHESEYTFTKVFLNEINISELTELGLETDHGFIYPGRYWIHQLSREDINLLESNHVQFQKMSQDEMIEIHARNSQCDNQQINEYPEVVNFKKGSMAGYYTLEEMYHELRQMRLKYPHLISDTMSYDSLRTIENRPVNWVRLSNNPTIKENKAAVLYTSLHHAREPMSLSQLIYFMWYLLENYDKNSEIHDLLNETEIYFVPCINPDGYKYNQTGAPQGGGMWRKNRWKNANGTARGVDLNRNYSEGWAYDDIGSSPAENSTVFRGPAAFSEPESRVIKTLNQEIQFFMILNYHTFGNYLLHPWSYKDEPCPDEAAFKNMGRVYTDENKYSIGTSKETVGYYSNGGSDDYLYQSNPDRPTFSFTPEVGHENDGFWPDSSKILSLSKATLRGNILFAYMANGYFEYNIFSDGFLLNKTENIIPISINQVGTNSIETNVSFKIIKGDAVLQNSSIQFQNEPAQNFFGEIMITPTGNYGDTIGIEVTRFFNHISIRDTNYFRIANSKISEVNYCTEIDLVDILSGNWDVDPSDYVSAETCYSDSPQASYEPNTVSEFITSTYFIPEGEPSFLNFWLKTQIEPLFDYAQVYVLVDGNEIPQCGKYSVPGSIFQQENEPVYEGNTLGWVYETIDLNDYQGKFIRIGFRMVSDTLNHFDGISIDDLSVTTHSSELNTKAKSLAQIELIPNPATETIQVNDLNSTKIKDIKIYDLLGRTCRVNVQQNDTMLRLDISHLNQGTYFLSMMSTDGQFHTARFIKI